MNVTRLLYRAARLSNTLRAARRGPVALAKRQVRRKVYRATNTLTDKAVRRIGL